MAKSQSLEINFSQPNTKPKGNSSGREHLAGSLSYLDLKKSDFQIKQKKDQKNKDFIKKNIESTENLMKKTPSHLSQDLKSENLFNYLKLKDNSFSIEDRFYKKAEIYQQKKLELKNKLAEEEINRCTFRPKTNHDESKLSSAEFIKRNDEYLKRKNKRQQAALEKAKNDKEKLENDLEVTLKPKICEKSKELLAKNTYTSHPAFQRLYNKKISLPKKQENKQSENESSPRFKPKINQVSQNLKRDFPAFQALHEQSKHKKSNSESQKVFQKILTENSEKILIQKFCKEFESKTSHLEGKLIVYSDFTSVLHELGFISIENSDDKEEALIFWNNLKKTEEKIETGQLFAGLLVAQGLMDRSEVFGEAPESLSKTFEYLYMNRKKKVSRREKNRSLDEYSFYPEIIPNSQSLAEKWRNAHRSAAKIEDMLVEEEMNKLEKLKKLKEKIEFEEKKECTFLPKTEIMPEFYNKTENEYSKAMKSSSARALHKGNALHSYFSIHQEKMQNSIRDLKKELDFKDMEQCTFVPHIKSSSGGNIESFLERMKERDRPKEVRNDGEGYFRFGRISKFKALSVFDPPKVHEKKRHLDVINL